MGPSANFGNEEARLNMMRPCYMHEPSHSFAREQSSRWTPKSKTYPPDLNNI